MAKTEHTSQHTHPYEGKTPFDVTIILAISVGSRNALHARLGSCCVYFYSMLRKEGVGGKLFRQFFESAGAGGGASALAAQEIDELTGFKKGEKSCRLQGGEGYA